MNQSEEVILVKLGGSVITDKEVEGKADTEKIRQLAAEIHSANSQTSDLLILSHGGGSFGHPPAERYQTMHGIRQPDGYLGVAVVRQAMIELNAIVIRNLIELDEPAVTFSPVSFLTTRDKQVGKLFLQPLINLLRHHLVPVMHGDVLTDETLGCTIFSGEKILNLVALRLAAFGFKPKLVIEVGKTDGIYDDKGDTIEFINRSNLKEATQQISASYVADVTGGMRHKVEEAWELSKVGIPSLLISGSLGNLENAILGKNVKGTWIKE